MLRSRSFACKAALTPQLGHFNLPKISNEPMVNFGPGSKERRLLDQAIKEMKESLDKNGPFKVPIVLNGQNIQTSATQSQVFPFDHQQKLCTYSEASKELVDHAIETALAAKPAWEAMPFNERAAIFLKAADLLTTKYRYKIMAATILGQSKNAWQCEIDTPCELADFLRFNCQYAAQIYAGQPTENAYGVWNRLEYRPLEGFVVAYSPFNFTAIGGNLAAAPALMGNVVLWKPSPMAIYSNYLIMEILKEAGLPDGVIQFIPGDAELITESTFTKPDFAGFHYTGSTQVFNKLWKKISDGVDGYKSYPRIVGETGGKNFHFLHESADIETAVHNTIRGAFEYQGQKCSATSRVYVPDTIWPAFKSLLTREHAKIKQGPPTDHSNFLSSVINSTSFNRIRTFLESVKKSSTQSILLGGGVDDSVGYFVEPTVVVTTDPGSSGMVDELFGPVVTIYVYPAGEFEKTLEIADKSSKYALTGSVFAKSRSAIITASNILRNTAGNFYINDKSTGAVVGQQPFGGGRKSGTNDKAGSMLNLLRWVSPRTIKENFLPLKGWGYESNKI